MWSAGPLPGGVFTMNDDTGTPSPCLSPSNSDAVELERSSSSGMTIATLGGGVALLSPGPRLGRLDLAVLGRSVGHELAEQLARDRRDRLARALERLLVRPGRLGGAADLPDVLEGRGLDLLVGGGRLAVMKGADVSTHAAELSAGRLRASGTRGQAHVGGGAGGPGGGSRDLGGQAPRQ